MIAHINIGSNLGNRAASIDRAVALLSDLGEVRAVSSPFVSRAWGYESDNEFLNVGVNLETDLPSLDLLEGLKRIERQIAPEGTHRTVDGGYADREIDLDLIARGAELISTPELTLPHPRMRQRAFVLGPLAELMPEWRHPKTHLTASEMLRLIQ